MKANGHINTSNLLGKSECITLTYSIKDVGNPTKAKTLKTELDKISGEESVVNLEMANISTEDEQTDMKYKIKLCDSDKIARDIKLKLDKYLTKKGGQTTLDEHE